MRIPGALITLLVCFFTGAACAQDNLPEFGKIDMEDMLLKECPFDKGANAMYLINTAKVVADIDPYTGEKTTTEYRVRIKIFDETGFSQASISIPYIGNSRITKINDLEGVIFTLDAQGKLVTQKLDKEQIFRERAKGKKARNKISFTFPGLQKGAVIEYRYTKVDRNDIKLRPWFFQEEIPCRYTKCSITYPSRFTELKCHFVASLPIERDTSQKTFSRDIFNEGTRGFAMRNVPAFKPEPLMSSLEDNLQRVEFSLQEGGFLSFDNGFKWRMYSRSLLKSKYFGAQFKLDIPGTKPFLDSVNAIADTAEKINRIYQYVKREIDWNDEKTFYSGDLLECVKNKSGSSAEMNILLLNLLLKAKITCVPVLISSRDNGKVDKTFPTLSQFNGVDILATANDVLYVLDATQKNLSYKTTPFNVLNSEGLIIDDEINKWVTITDRRNLMNTQLYVNAMMDSTGMMKGKGNIYYTGIAKAEAIKDAEEAEKKRDAKGMIGDNSPDLKIDSSSEEHANDDTDTLLHIINFHASLTNTENLYFINPFMFSLFNKNPFKDTTRYTDVDFGCGQSYATRIIVSVPQNFNIEELPKSLAIRMEDSSMMFRREFFSGNNQVLIRHSFTINRAVFGSEEYPAVKTFFDKVYALINEQIVLKKKDG